MICCLSLLSKNVTPQNTNPSSGNINDRSPAVAGTFYPADADKLRREIADFFETAVPPRNGGNVLALIVPHAGYVFSGQVAASGFRQLNPDKKFKRIFLIGSSHTTHFEGASIYAEGCFITPLGCVPVDTIVSQALIDEYPFFRFDRSVHRDEHSLEVQLPFLQVRLKHEFSIVPIVIGGQSVSNCRQIAATLKPFLNEENLFVISSDFSHYPNNKEACIVDKLTASAILTNDPDSLLLTLENNALRSVDGLLTSLCGWTSVLTLMYMSQHDTACSYQLVQYMNSSDSPYGDTNRVVGYQSIVLFGEGRKESKEFNLEDPDRKALLDLARNTIGHFLETGKISEPDTSGFSASLRQPCGAFVSLHKAGSLRGCIGHFKADLPLYKIVQQMAIAAATEDYRFPKVRMTEMDSIDIEISVLSPLKKIHSIEEIKLGKHGIYIVKGGKTGTFLPQVATETGWNLEEFLGYCARDKAGIGWEGWKTADIYIYSAIVFGENETSGE